MSSQSRINSRRGAATLLMLLGLALGWLTTTATAQAQATDTPVPTQPPPSETPPPTQPPPVVVNIQVPPSGGLGGSGSTSSAEPILNVTGYVTDPDPVKSSQSFTLTVTIKNVGAKHADAVSAAVASNSAFVGLGAPVELGKLDPDQTGTFSLPVQAASLSNGAYDLQLTFTYRVGEDREQSVTRSIGIRVGGGGTGVVGRPQVVVESATVDTALGVGSAFDVSVVYRNVGERKAYDVSVAPKLNEVLSPAGGSGSAQLGDLGAGQAVTHTLSLRLNQANASGHVAQIFGLEYRDSNNKTYTSDETVSLDLGSAGLQSPHLIITAHATTPERLAPGDTFALTLNVTNVGAGPARRVLASLGDDSGLKPFLPLGTSNVAYAPEVKAGSTMTLTYTLLMDGGAAGGTYPLKVSLEYEDAFGEAQSDAEIVGLLALARPQLQIGLTKPLSDSVAVGQAFDIPVEVVNVGRQRVDVSTVEITSPDLKLTKSSLFVGPLDSSISGGLTARATALQAGPATFKIVVHYRDELNQMQTVEREITLEVRATAGVAPTTPTAATTAESSGLWQALLRFFGLGS